MPRGLIVFCSCLSFLRTCVVSVVSFLMFVVVVGFSTVFSSAVLHAEMKTITQLVPSNPDWGCVLQDGENVVTFKGNAGRSLESAIAPAAKKLRRQKSRFRKLIKRLKEKKRLSKKVRQKLRKFKASLQERTLLLKGVKSCQDGSLELSTQSSTERSFAFICQHAFNLRSVADGEASCGIDLRSLQDLRDEVNSKKRALTLRVALRVVADSLGDKCRESGGTYLTPEMPELFFPLYHGYCAAEGEEPMTFSVGTMPIVLGMETVNEDCLVARAPSSGSKDPCDCYDPDNRGGGGGGESGGEEKTPPSDEDCLVMRMDTVNEDC